MKPTNSSLGAAIHAGNLLPFEQYLTQSRNAKEVALHWDINVINQNLGQRTNTRGALNLNNPARRMVGEMASGISMAVQIIAPREKTQSHAHSFWHIYIVVSGQGEVFIDEKENMKIQSGDVIYIPAWSHHQFINPHNDAPLMLYAMQNLPAMAEMGTLMRKESNDVTNIYSE
ncbi:cupin domain-containing protein [Serratia plymuthica]|jgi:gentisate 1,2-dioxygenase|uniref:Cupin domain-containing protein n=1 Tax=Serratia plymuthica TaxID=82996 RepID=A0A318NZI2_SERPL|nr:cupin domain-containing protein [Serratia plymuthica]AGO57448.1 hypothetical protein SOD_c45050 [Serratia plymuthica 4Rx13]MEE4408064.1 cupin domain-containing protein [Serratia sp. C2(2)]MEE4449644.1 cupin domain-containing protein [Serratia sp. C2(1)]PYD36996.1 cupin domain-containing protein [Serratia plymuthica]